MFNSLNNIFYHHIHIFPFLYDEKLYKYSIKQTLRQIKNNLFLGLSSLYKYKSVNKLKNILKDHKH